MSTPPRDPHPLQNRILYVIGQLHSGGSERQLYYLLRDMDRRRYQPAVAVWNLSEADVYLDQIRRLDVPVYGFPGVMSARAKLRDLRRLVRTLRPEVVHSYSFYLNLAAYCSVHGTKAIALGSMRSALHLDKRVNGRVLGKLSARWPRTQIYNSYEAANCADRSSSPFIPKRRIVVRNGVDLDGFPFLPLPHSRRTTILGVGSLVDVKRWDRLLTAAAEMKRRQLEFGVRIVGDGPLWSSLEAEATRLGVSDCVAFQGYSHDVPRLMAEANFIVHTSDAEGCPNVLMEAMACGRATVATDVGDARYLIDDGVTGYLIPRGQAAIMLDRILTLAGDPELCKRMGAAGRAKAEREFDLNRMVTDTFRAYRAMGWMHS